MFRVPKLHMWKGKCQIFYQWRFGDNTQMQVSLSVFVRSGSDQSPSLNCMDKRALLVAKPSGMNAAGCRLHQGFGSSTGELG